MLFVIMFNCLHCIINVIEVSPLLRPISVFVSPSVHVTQAVYCP